MNPAGLVRIRLRVGERQPPTGNDNGKITNYLKHGQPFHDRQVTGWALCALLRDPAVDLNQDMMLEPGLAYLRNDVPD